MVRHQSVQVVIEEHELEEVRRRSAERLQAREQPGLGVVPRNDVPAAIEKVCRVRLELVEERAKCGRDLCITVATLFNPVAGQREEMVTLGSREIEGPRQRGEHRGGDGVRPSLL